MLDNNSIIPLYEQLKVIIEEAINNGVYKPGDRLKSEVDMAKEYDVSVVTVRKAINELAMEYIVEKRQGKGTFVAVQKYKKDLNQIVGFSEMSKMSGDIAGAKVLYSRIITPNKNVIKELELGLNSKVINIARTRYLNDEPIMIERNYFAMEYEFLLNVDLENNSLFKILHDERGIIITKSSRTIEICRANKEESDNLKVPLNGPLLLVNGIVRDSNNKIIYFGNQIINGEKYKLYV